MAGNFSDPPILRHPSVTMEVGAALDAYHSQTSASFKRADFNLRQAAHDLLSIANNSRPLPLPFTAQEMLLERCASPHIGVVLEAYDVDAARTLIFGEGGPKVVSAYTAKHQWPPTEWESALAVLLKKQARPDSFPAVTRRIYVEVYQCNKPVQGDATAPVPADVKPPGEFTDAFLLTLSHVRDNKHLLTKEATVFLTSVFEPETAPYENKSARLLWLAPVPKSLSEQQQIGRSSAWDALRVALTMQCTPAYRQRVARIRFEGGEGSVCGKRGRE